MLWNNSTSDGLTPVGEGPTILHYLTHPFLVKKATLNTQKCLVMCKRCWRCCIKALLLPEFKLRELHSKLVFDLLRLDTALFMCPVLGVNEKGQPHCLIYPFRPAVCREYLCLKEKSSAHVATKSGRYRKEAQAQSATVTYTASTDASQAIAA